MEDEPSLGQIFNQINDLMKKECMKNFHHKIIDNKTGETVAVIIEHGINGKLEYISVKE